MVALSPLRDTVWGSLPRGSLTPDLFGQIRPSWDYGNSYKREKGFFRSAEKVIIH